MKNVGLYVVSFLIGAGLMFGYTQTNTTQNTSVKSTTKIPTQVPSSTGFSVSTPPSQSLKGTITSRSGILFWESRTASEPSELTETVPILQGERLITEDKSSAEVHFDTFGTLELSENADVSFIQTFPADFVVEQKKGTVTYTMDGTTPLSIRLRSALLTKTTGIVTVTITDGDPLILITTTQGTAQIGFNDLDYVSQVFSLREGQVYEYNSDDRTAVNTKNK